MKILIVGINNYVGTRLLPVLIENGHEVLCLVKSKSCFARKHNLSEQSNITVIEGDLLKPKSQIDIPGDIETAFFFTNSNNNCLNEFANLDELLAKNSVDRLEQTKCKQIVYLSQAAPFHPNLKIENILTSGIIPVTILRAGFIVGTQSPTFEIVQKLAEKFPILLAPKWLNRSCFPVDIRNVLAYLLAVAGNIQTLNCSFDITGPKAITIKQMITDYAMALGLKRRLINIPLDLTLLSSAGLKLMNSVSLYQAKMLINNLNATPTTVNDTIKKVIDIYLYSYTESLNFYFTSLNTGHNPLAFSRN
ncbi:hypothetical protein C3K47_13425 [Solitalea longa]|uniref:NAD-dependent epimerase/dehydratase domain-containing protein n=1 Tax=Solitalea longa TaxID=2079460 RepID=A0A2S4ZZM9_9SPHI|nr:NAD-dependent epimerase/dehydratase family protein [Solitalea longa]POY35755.1 hypothetical protein C3K47_13425 [Solitalea longa]